MHPSSKRARAALVMVLATLVAIQLGAGPLLAAPAEAEGPRGPARPVDLNSASAEELAELPGVGPALAERIIEFRKKNGPFRRAEDLLKVRGIGEKSFQKIRPHVKLTKAG